MNKKLKNMVVALVVCIFISSCANSTEDCNTPETAAPQAEITELENFINTNGFLATKDYRGFFYSIVEQGSGAKPNNCSTVTVNYVGSLKNGTVFDSSSNVSFKLSNLITGWQQGLALIGKGGKIKLYIPPSLGYGNQASASIPANSILVFEIELLNVS
jgi:FKBP-type peptidyl-prolyl cis-trans isomerase FkpA